MHARVARINIRSTREEKEKFEEAAALEGEELSEFLRKSARMRAKQVIEEHTHIILSNRDRDIFLKVLANPPKPSARLKNAIKRYRKNVRKK